MSPLDQLPVEIKLKIFMATDVRTLEMSRSVCRDWNRIITGSPSLQHKIELAVSGVGQAPVQTAEAPRLEDRTAILRVHRAAWRNPVWREFRTIPAPQTDPRIISEVSFLRDNVLARKGWTESNMYLTRIPSRRLATTEWKSWTVNLGEEMGCSEFTMDPSQDLLVLMETCASSMGSGASMASVHLRSLETGATHPLACSNIFYVSFSSSPQSELQCEGQIVGDHLGVLYHRDTSPNFKNTVLIWNWKTSDKILEIANPSVFSFSFMDESHVLIASKYDYIEERVRDNSNRCAAVWVYGLVNRTYSGTKLTEGTYRCAFFLPPSLWLDPVYVRCNPISIHQSLMCYSSVDDLPDSIVKLCQHCHADVGFQLPEVVENEDDEAVVQIFVPASRLRARMSAAAPGQLFSWHEWGPTDAYVEIDSRPDELDIRLDNVFGMRTVSPAADFDKLYIYDFEPLRISRYFRRTNAKVSTGRNNNEARNGTRPPKSVRHTRYRLSWDKNAERMLRGFEGRERDSSKELRGLGTVVDLPKELWGLEWESYDSLITDDAVVILNVRRREPIHVLRL